MKKVIVLCSLMTGMLLLAANNILQAQNNPDHKRTMHWYFGANAGLDFSSGHPVADTTGKMYVLQGSATISDTSGNLLFYTDGKRVWNRFGQVMPNGTGLGVGVTATPVDCSVIVPKPGDNSIYYIFTVDGWENQFKNGLRYHIVDMKLDNGKGDVTQKNIQLFTPCTEQLSATKDSSKCGYWVASHELHTANFRAYHVTSAGVDTVPVISKTGIDYSKAQQSYNLNGGSSLKFTPNGIWAGSLVTYSYVITHLPDYIDILKFNKGSGQFSYVISFPVDTNTNNSIGFSPNSRYLYYEDGGHVARDCQIDISSGDSSTIINSKTVVWHSKNNVGIAQGIQIGYDGKIYLCAEYIGDSLSVINNPNVKGLGCEVKKNAIYLNGGPCDDLPRFVTNFLINDTSSICTVGINEITKKNSLVIYPNPANDWILIKSDFSIQEIKIIDLMGITIHEAHKIRDIPSFNCQLFANGIYIIQLLTSDHKTITTKLIVQH